MGKICTISNESNEPPIPSAWIEEIEWKRGYVDLKILRNLERQLRGKEVSKYSWEEFAALKKYKQFLDGFDLEEIETRQKVPRVLKSTHQPKVAQPASQLQQAVQHVVHPATLAVGQPGQRVQETSGGFAKFVEVIGLIALDDAEDLLSVASGPGGETSCRGEHCAAKCSFDAQCDIHREGSIRYEQLQDPSRISETPNTLRTLKIGH